MNVYLRYSTGIMNVYLRYSTGIMNVYLRYSTGMKWTKWTRRPSW
jgi:hypothetical protein